MIFNPTKVINKSVVINSVHVLMKTLYSASSHLAKWQEAKRFCLDRKRGFLSFWHHRRVLNTSYSSVFSSHGRLGLVALCLHLPRSSSDQNLSSLLSSSVAKFFYPSYWLSIYRSLFGNTFERPHERVHSPDYICSKLNHRFYYKNIQVSQTFGFKLPTSSKTRIGSSAKKFSFQKYTKINLNLKFFISRQIKF